MSFQKATKQSLPQMVDTFKRQFETVRADVVQRQSYRSLNSKFKYLDSQIKNIEHEMDNAPDSDVFECSDKFHELNISYQEFKNTYKNVAEIAENENDNNTNNNNNNNGNYDMVDQDQVEQQADDLEHLRHEVTTIVTNMHEIKAISDQVYKEIEGQRVKIIGIDNAIETAKGEMEKGNNEMDKAEEHQKKCQIC